MGLEDHLRSCVSYSVDAEAVRIVRMIEEGKSIAGVAGSLFLPSWASFHVAVATLGLQGCDFEGLMYRVATPDGMSTASFVDTVELVTQWMRRDPGGW
jgi:hypothetical protein